MLKPEQSTTQSKTGAGEDPSTKVRAIPPNEPANKLHLGAATVKNRSNDAMMFRITT